MKSLSNNAPFLTNRTTVSVRFSEVDSMQIVWHGGYVRYFEDGREAFGKQYSGLGYMQIYEHGFVAPIVKLEMEFKQPLKYGDTAVVETRFIKTDAAKICFEYLIFKEPDLQIVAIGSSTQVFLNNEFKLELGNPEFYTLWKKRWGII
jgi:acyl-CoA thioester hydrolase